MTQRVALPYFGPDPLPWVRPAAGGFPTWLNQQPGGLSAASLTDHANGLPLVLNAPQDGTLYYTTAALKTKGAPPWTITTAQAAFCVIHQGIAINYPLVLYNSGADKALLLSWYLGNASNDGRVTLIQVTDATTGSASLDETDIGAGFPIPDYFEWFRVTNDGTNLTFQISPEGQLWMTVFTVALADFIISVDKIGFGADRLKQNSVGGTQPLAAILWSWVET